MKSIRYVTKVKEKKKERKMKKRKKSFILFLLVIINWISLYKKILAKKNTIK